MFVGSGVLLAHIVHDRRCRIRRQEILRLEPIRHVPGL
jgi:hypothetical protein